MSVTDRDLATSQKPERGFKYLHMLEVDDNLTVIIVNHFQELAVRELQAGKSLGGVVIKVGVINHSAVQKGSEMLGSRVK